MRRSTDPMSPGGSMRTPVPVARSRWARYRRPYRPPRRRVDHRTGELDGAGSRTGRIDPVEVGTFGVRPTLRTPWHRRNRLGPPLGHRSPRSGSDSRGRSGRCGPSGLPRPGGPSSGSTLSGSPDARSTDFSLQTSGMVPSREHGRESVVPKSPVGGRGHDTVGGLVGHGPEHLPNLAFEGGGLQSRRGHGRRPTSSNRGGSTFGSPRVPQGPFHWPKDCASRGAVRKVLRARRDSNPGLRLRRPP